MEISEIPEVEEDNEIDHDNSQSINSQMELEFHRMHTEYGEEEQAYDLYAIEEVFKRYINFAISLILSGILLQLYFYNQLRAVFSLLPLLLLEFKLLFDSLIRFKDEFEIIPNICKSDYFIDTIESFGNTISYIILSLYLEQKLNCISVVCIPWVLTSIYKILTKVNLANNCISFSVIVRMVSRWVKIFTFILFGLKIDHFFSYSWQVALIPIYIGIALCLVIGIASLVLIMLQYFSKESEKNAFITNLWLVYTFLGASATSVIFLFTFTWKMCMVLPIFYIFGFVFITSCILKKLAMWWWDFFLSDFSGPLPMPACSESPLPLPESQLIHIEGSFSEKLKKAIITTPKVLVKLSNPQYQSRDEKICRKKHNRSASHLQEIHTIKVKAKKPHSRSRSMAVGNKQIETFDLSGLQLLCKFCFRGTANCRFEKCGHGGVCMHCGDVILNSKSKCYVCGNDIVGIKKIAFQDEASPDAESRESIN